MVYLLIAVSLGPLRPDLALGRLGAGIEEEREEVGGGGGAEISQIRKYGFGTPGDSGAMRVPPTCQAVGKRCALAFPMVSLPTRFTRGYLWPLSALEVRCRKH